MSAISQVGQPSYRRLRTHSTAQREQRTILSPVGRKQTERRHLIVCLLSGCSLAHSYGWFGAEPPSVWASTVDLLGQESPDEGASVSSTNQTPPVGMQRTLNTRPSRCVSFLDITPMEVDMTSASTARTIARIMDCGIPDRHLRQRRPREVSDGPGWPGLALFAASFLLLIPMIRSVERAQALAGAKSKAMWIYNRRIIVA